MKHIPQKCSKPGCKEEATRWYEEGNKTIYVCLEHEDINEAEETGFIKNGLGQTVELAVYSCSDKCQICNDLSPLEIFEQE